MWGTLWPGDLGKRRTVPGTSERPLCSPCSSLHSSIICIPRHIPSTGTEADASTMTSLRSPSCSMPSRNAPTPGRTTPSADASSPGSAVTTGLPPAFSSPLETDLRFPRP